MICSLDLLSLGHIHHVSLSFFSDISDVSRPPRPVAHPEALLSRISTPAVLVLSRTGSDSLSFPSPSSR